MFRVLVLAAVAALLLVSPVAAKRIARPFTPVEKLVRAETVVVGKVTALEKEMVSAEPDRGVKEKVSYQVAVVKVETALVGGANATHIKVGFLPQPKGDPVPGRPGRGGFGPVTLAEGNEGVFFLTKHHSGEFYIIGAMSAPIETKADDYKAQLGQVTRAAAALADPSKALKSDKAADRTFAAVVLVSKYRTYPDGAADVKTEKVSADESKLLLKALSEASWKPDPNDATAPNAYQAFSQLGLNEKDGWKFPMVKPGEDFIEKTKEAFTAWLAEAGKDYQVNKLVGKK